MFDTIAPRYDLVNRVMTFGLDRRWRRATVGALGLPARRAASLDVACGTGDLCRELAAAGYRADRGGPVDRDAAHARTAAPLAPDRRRMPSRCPLEPLTGR